MKEEGQPPKKPPSRETRKAPPSRKLNFVSRVRVRFRQVSDRLLGTDLIWSAAFVLVTLSLLGSERCGIEIDRFVVGEPAPYDLRASYDVYLEDRALSEENRRQARERIPDVYMHDGQRRVDLSRQLSSIFAAGRDAMENASLLGSPDPADAARQALEGRVRPEVLDVLVATRFDVELERELSSSLSRALQRLVVGNKALLEREPEILLRHLPDQRSEILSNFDQVSDLDEARRSFRGQLEGALELPRKQEAALIDFAASFLDANVYLDAEATARRRGEAAAAVPPVTFRVARGSLLVKKGDLLTPDMMDKLEAARRDSRDRLGTREILAQAFVVILLAFFLYRYCLYHQRAFTKLKHLHSLMVLMLVSMLLLTKAVLWLAGELVDSLGPPFNNLGSYTYLIPLGGGAILVALLANGRIAMVYAAFAALLYGALNQGDFYVTLWAMIVQLSGVYAISTYRERAALLRAGLVVGGAGAVTALAVETLRGDLEPLARSLYGAGLAFVGGAVGIGLLISFSLPLLERLFSVLTDIRLLELSNVNNPLLSELAVKAPGSYNHSLVVGTLAEEGAKAIGANSLFCRVAAFYHDIGKISYAEYYVENQRGVNPHDRLSPSMSALIIASHVKDGIKMAREAGIPEQIIDIIPQHHGTKLMTFFYEKAKSGADPSLTKVKEADFRYPGPKPQTREAAIFMLADAVEAAARTVEEPTANRLREMIRKVTNSIVLDRQLDSCDLTFADLDRIQTAFLKLLVGMYHHRVDYPGFDFGKPKGKPKPVEIQDKKVAKGT